MATLTKEAPAGVIGKRQWWSLGSVTALVAYGTDGCGISICDQDNRDITDQVVKKMDALGQQVRTAQSIDSVMIRCSEESIISFLEDVEKVIL